MSLVCTQRAWPLSLRSNQKLVLLALADFSDDAGVCWPSLTTLATKCQLSRRAIQRIVRELESSQLITVQRRLTGDGGSRSSAYSLMLRAGS